jgi:hypothetical protein
MESIPDDEVELEARAILRETIQRSGWYPTLSERDRQAAIERDVDQHWPVMIREAKQRLKNRVIVDVGGVSVVPWARRA